MRLITTLTMACLLLIPSMAANAQGAAAAGESHPNGGSVWEEFYVQDIDLEGFMDRLLVVLTDENMLGKYPEVAEVASMLEGMGYFDMATTHAEYAITGDSIYGMSSTTFNHSGDTYYAKLLDIPDAELRSAKYVAKDDYLLYFAVNGVVDKLMAMLEMETIGPGGSTMSMMEMLEMSPGGEGADVIGMIKAMKLDELLGSILSGEIALVVYEAPDLMKIAGGDIQPNDIHAALMVGINDPAYLLEMVGNFGESIGLVEIPLDDENWHGYTMAGEEGIGFAFNDEILIASPSFDNAGLHVAFAESEGGLDVPACQFHFDLNFEALHNDVIHPAVQMLSQMSEVEVVPQHEAMTFLFKVPDASELGHIVMTAHTQDGNVMSTFEMKKAVVTYLTFYLALGLDVAAQSGAFE